MNYIEYTSLVLSELESVVSGVNVQEIDNVVKLLASVFKKNTIITAGAGRMGLSLKAFCMRLKHLGFDAWSLGDTSLPRTGNNDILIIGSGSGETPSMVTIAEQAIKHNQRIILFTCNRNSQIAKLSKDIVIIPTVSTLNANNNSIQLMKSLVEQSMLLITDILILLLVDKLNLKKESISINHSILE